MHLITIFSILMCNKSFKCTHFMVSLNLGKHNFWILRKTNAIISLLAQGSKNSVFLLPAPHTKEKLLDVRSSMNPRDKALCMCADFPVDIWLFICWEHISSTKFSYNILTHSDGLWCHSELEASKGLRDLESGETESWESWLLAGLVKLHSPHTSLFLHQPP